jgi:GntR family phosphonate transport system transcriptional regulator
MSLPRTPGNALWHQLETALAAEIEAGARRAGEQLPTEPELMRRLGVSRFTVRQAIASLERRGLVRVEQGRGTFVHREVLTYAISRRTRFYRNLIEQGFDPGGAVLLQEIVPAEEEVAAMLRLRPGEAVVHRQAIGTANELPVELADVYLPAERFPDFAAVRAAHATFTATFAAYGIRDYLFASTTVEARMPTIAEARLLRQPASSPVLVVTRVDCDLESRPILYGRAAWCSERVVLDLSRDEHAV